MRRAIFFMAALASVAAFVNDVRAAALSNGNLVVVRINSTSGAAGAAFVEEYTPGGTLVQSLPLPTADGAGDNQTCTMAGNLTTNEGYLSLSTNGQYLTLACHDAALGTTVATAGAHNRVVARVDMSGNIDTTTRFNPGTVGFNVRSAVMDGNNIWVTSNRNDRAVMHTTFGSTTGTVLTNTFAGTVVGKIFNDGIQNQLYLSADNNTSTVGMYSVGVGLPTSTGITPARLNGFPLNNTPDVMTPADFWFADPSTIYFSDTRAIASGGGLQKWTLNSGVWSWQYTLNSGLAGGLFGLTGIDEGGVTRLYASTTDNKLVSVLDTGAASAFSTLATGSAGSIFRGVVVTVPEPGSLSLLALGCFALIRRR